MRTDEGKSHYKRRKAIVEAPFRNMKIKGMKILVKGRDKVKTRFKMFATAHNIEKTIGSIMRRGVQATSV
jgi:Transposase DDE domain